MKWFRMLRLLFTEQYNGEKNIDAQNSTIASGLELTESPMRKRMVTH